MKRLTQRELGKLIGKAEISIRKYENGSIQVPNDVLSKIADALGVSIIKIMALSQQEENISQYQVFINYLESIGYSFKYDHDVLEWHNEDVIKDGQVIGQAQVSDKETFTVSITKNEVSTTMTKEEFEEFQSTIEKSVEFEIFKASQK